MQRIPLLKWQFGVLNIKTAIWKEPNNWKELDSYIFRINAISIFGKFSSTWIQSILCRYKFSTWKTLLRNCVNSWLNGFRSIRCKNNDIVYMGMTIKGYTRGGWMDMVQLGAQMEQIKYSVLWLRNLYDISNQTAFGDNWTSITNTLY